MRRRHGHPEGEEDPGGGRAATVQAQQAQAERGADDHARAVRPLRRGQEVDGGRGGGGGGGGQDVHVVCRQLRHCQRRRQQVEEHLEEEEQPRRPRTVLVVDQTISENKGERERERDDNMRFRRKKKVGSV